MRRYYLALNNFFLLMLAGVAAAVPQLAFANDTQIGTTFCTIYKWMTGNTGRGLATICIITLGIVMMTTADRKMRSAIKVPAAIAVIFGATSIVGVLMGAVGGSGTVCP
jgi:type IV secretory pathway VirB2 component (pilin)